MNTGINKSRNKKNKIFGGEGLKTFKKSLKIFLLYLLFWFILFNFVSCIQKLF